MASKGDGKFTCTAGHIKINLPAGKAAGFENMNIVISEIEYHLSELMSQAAACDGLVYSVNYNGQNSGTQGYALPLFED